MTDNAPAGATPVVPGATPGQTPPATPPAAGAAASPPATGDPDALGDAGKRALDAMKAERDAAKRAAAAAERERDELKALTATDSEKAVTAARKEAAAEVTARYDAMIRRSEVKVALAGAGINPSVLDLAAKADEFASLKVGDGGEVEGLAQAITAFKGARADLFGVPRIVGTGDAGAGAAAARGTGKTFTREQIADPAFYKAHRAEILEATNAGRITG